MNLGFAALSWKGIDMNDDENREGVLGHNNWRDVINDRHMFNGKFERTTPLRVFNQSETLFERLYDLDRLLSENQQSFDYSALITRLAIKEMLIDIKEGQLQ